MQLRKLREKTSIGKMLALTNFDAIGRVVSHLVGRYPRLRIVNDSLQDLALIYS